MKIKKERMPFKSYEKKQKYDIKEKGVVVIEKDNTLFNISIVIIKIVLYTILLSLAFIGLISLIIPETRNVLIYQAESVFDEFIKLIGG